MSPLDYPHVTEFKPVPAPPGGGKRKGRKPQGQYALTGAERQARYRQHQADNRAAAPPRPPQPIRRASRPQQWHAAVAKQNSQKSSY